MTPPNVLLVSPPGMGKTAFVLASYDHVEILLASSMVEEDIAGLPYRDGESEKRTNPPFYERLHKASKAGKSTALFLDEIDKARRSVADTLLSLITSPRGYGVRQLPPDTIILGASNPPSWGGGDGISEAMSSRFSIIDYKPDIPSWCELTSAKYGEFGELVSREVKKGHIPLLETTGEEWHTRRQTCPRTIWLSMDALMMKTPFGSQEVVKGLVTPNVADRLISLYMMSHSQTRDITDQVLEQREEVVRTNPIGKSKKVSVLRV